jgi:hypothetical protein
VQPTPHFAAWLSDNIGSSAMSPVTEYIEGEFVIVDGYGDADEFGVAFETVVSVDLGVQTI